MQAEFIYFGPLRRSTLHLSANNHMASIHTYLLLCVCSCGQAEVTI